MPIINQIVKGSGGGVDEYANYITIENTLKGTTYVESTEIATACDQISYFLFGTNNSEGVKYERFNKSYWATCLNETNYG